MLRATSPPRFLAVLSSERGLRLSCRSAPRPAPSEMKRHRPTAAGLSRGRGGETTARTNGTRLECEDCKHQQSSVVGEVTFAFQNTDEAGRTRAERLGRTSSYQSSGPSKEIARSSRHLYKVWRLHLLSLASLKHITSEGRDRRIIPSINSHGHRGQDPSPPPGERV